MRPDALHELDSVMRCPVCEGVVEVVQDIQNPQPIQRGNIIICGHCGTICKVGDSNLVKMKKEELDALDEQSKGIIALACAGVMAKRHSDKVQDRIDKELRKLNGE